MYLDHFGVNRVPFSNTPDTGLFFPGGQQGAIMEVLVDLILSAEGITRIVGEVGCGKTMLCRMLESSLPSQVETIYLLNPHLSPAELLRAMVLDLSLDLPRDADRFVCQQAIQKHLARRAQQKRPVVLLIEEAQSMPRETLEEICMLSNLESGQTKLIQVVLFGQPELNTILEESGLRQLRDRIAHSFFLKPFSAREVDLYLDFRMRGTGYRGPHLFDQGAVGEMHRVSRGSVRRINGLAHKALLAAFAADAHGVERCHVRQAARQGSWHRHHAPRRLLGLLARITGGGGRNNDHLMPWRWAVTAGVMGMALGSALTSGWPMNALGPQLFSPATVSAPAPVAGQESGVVAGTGRQRDWVLELEDLCPSCGLEPRMPAIAEYQQEPVMGLPVVRRVPSVEYGAPPADADLIGALHPAGYAVPPRPQKPTTIRSHGHRAALTGTVSEQADG